MTPPIGSARTPRPRTDAPASNNAAAAQQTAFDEQQAEHAELLRELDALQTMLLAQLKNEDEILKKWIAMI